MRARIVLTGFITILAAACSSPASDPAMDAAGDEPAAAPDLALSPPSDAIPVASDLEMNRPARHAMPEPEPETPAPLPADVPLPEPEPIGVAIGAELEVTPESVPVPTRHVHPKAAPEVAVAETASDAPEEGGGKPTGVSTGLGPVPDRNWGDVGIMDDPDPRPTGPGWVMGGDAVIIRGGMGGLDDDCAIHPRGGMIADGPASRAPGTLVNDRDPRRGALINERAPRTSQRPSLPRGGGFPRGGIR